jgi:hypothetical protein
MFGRKFKQTFSTKFFQRTRSCVNHHLKEVANCDGIIEKTTKKRCVPFPNPSVLQRRSRWASSSSSHLTSTQPKQRQPCDDTKELTAIFSPRCRCAYWHRAWLQSAVRARSNKRRHRAKSNSTKRTVEPKQTITEVVISSIDPSKLRAMGRDVYMLADKLSRLVCGRGCTGWRNAILVACLARFRLAGNYCDHPANDPPFTHQLT